MHIAAIGRFRSHGEFRWEQVSQHTILHCIREGRGVFIDNGVRFTAAAGDVVLFQPGHHYQYFDLPGTPWRYDFLTFDGHESDNLLRVLEIADPYFSLGRNHAFWTRLDELITAYGQARLAFTFACQLNWTLLDTLAQPLAIAQNTGLGARVRDYLERMETEFPTVDQLAFRFNVSRTTLFRSFRACTGVSVKQWIDERRFRRAQDLLRVSDAPVFEVARLCGFRDALYFSRAFKQRFGISPKAWRMRQTHY